MAIAIVWGYAWTGVDLAFMPEDRSEDLTPFQQNIIFVQMLSTAFVFAAVYAVIFAQIGAEIDKPLWKFGGFWESLKRFYQLWLILLLISFAQLQLAFWAIHSQGDQDLAAMFDLMYMMFLVVVIPFGACVMFLGRFQREEVSRAATTLMRQFPRTLVLLLVNLSLVVFVQAIATQDFPRLARPLLDVIGVYGDCVVFAGAWIICIYDREEAEDEDADLF